MYTFSISTLLFFLGCGGSLKFLLSRQARPVMLTLASDGCNVLLLSVWNVGMLYVIENFFPLFVEQFVCVKWRI